MPTEQGDSSTKNGSAPSYAVPGSGSTTGPATGGSNSSFNGSLPDSVSGIDASYLNGTDSGSSSSTGSSPSSAPGSDVTGGGLGSDSGLPSYYSPAAGSGFSAAPGAGGGIDFSPGSNITTLAGAAAPGGAGFAAPGGDINLTGAGFPDPTSTAAGDSDSFSSRFQPANDAVKNGTFDPQGAAYSGSDGSGVDLASLPTSASPTVGTGSVGGTPAQVNPALLGNYGPTQEQGGVAPAGGAPSGDFGTNLNTAMTQTLANPGPAPSSSPVPAAAPSSKIGSDSSGGGSLLDKLATGATNSIAKNPLGIATAAGGLGLNLFQGNKDPEGLSQLRDAASTLQNTGSVLQSYLKTGTLPAGMQASVDQATAAAKARIISNYASRGLSTDPSKNSALAQELAGVQNNAIITAAQLGDKLMSQGISATGMSQQIYNAIMNQDVARSKATQSAIASFASALAGGGNQVSGKVAA